MTTLSNTSGKFPIFNLNNSRKISQIQEKSFEMRGKKAYQFFLIIILVSCFLFHYFARFCSWHRHSLGNFLKDCFLTKKKKILPVFQDVLLLTLLRACCCSLLFQSEKIKVNTASPHATAVPSFYDLIL